MWILSYSSNTSRNQIYISPESIENGFINLIYIISTRLSARGHYILYNALGYAISWKYHITFKFLREKLLQNIWWVIGSPTKKKKVSRYVGVVNAFEREKKRGEEKIWINIKSRHMCTGIGMAWHEKEKDKKYTI